MAWFGLVWPALLLNYFGQGGLLIDEPDAIENPFYGLAPSWALYPMLLLATAATVIASQAVISGAYSLARQAVHLGYLPRLEVRHTSAVEAGQIYVPVVNWLLLACVVALVIGFGSSSNLAAAYGIAVTGTMIVTTLLSYVVFRRYSRISPVMLVAVAAGFLVIDVAFFSANLLKIVQGGWFPILIAVLVWYVMSTWIQGRSVLLARISADALPIEHLLERLDKPPIRVARTAVYMTGNPGTVPRSLLHKACRFGADRGCPTRQRFPHRVGALWLHGRTRRACGSAGLPQLRPCRRSHGGFLLPEPGDSDRLEKAGFAAVARAAVHHSARDGRGCLQVFQDAAGSGGGTGYADRDMRGHSATCAAEGSKIARSRYRAWPSSWEWRQRLDSYPPWGRKSRIARGYMEAAL
jgi:hypothetical protein